MDENKVLSVMSGKGKELSDYLRRELGIPDNCYKFSVIFELDEAVRVEVGYFPKEGSDKRDF